MQLLDFQAALGTAICLPDPSSTHAGCTQLAELLSSDGFAFTCAIQRSWCEGRLGLLARHTLAALPPQQRKALVCAWVDRGGGRRTFGAEEAVKFLDFLAGHLRDNAEALHWCRVEQAIHRATMARDTFVQPTWPDDGATLLGRGAFATLVTQRHEGDSCKSSLFFAPGLSGLVRAAEPIECLMWKQLAFARPINAWSSAAKIGALKAMVAEGIVATTNEVRLTSGIEGQPGGEPDAPFFRDL
jgi:hypothetical protein